MITVFHLPQGRLGNILFQLVAASELAGQSGRVVTLASDATENFDWDANFLVLKVPSFLKSRIDFFWGCMLRGLIKTKVLGVISPKQIKLSNNCESETVDLFIKRGLLANKFVLIGFFQHDNYKLVRPKLKEKIKSNSETKLKNIPYDRRVAVHFRFGDYEKFNVYGKQGTEMPIDFYINAFMAIEKIITVPQYVIFSDDKDKAKVVMKNLRKSNVMYEGYDFVDDFYGISSCAHAVVSASSFAWWASNLINNPQKIIVAPEFWLGFKSKMWFPLSIKSNHFTYVSTNKYAE